MIYVIIVAVGMALVYTAACAAMPHARCWGCRGQGLRTGRSAIRRRPTVKPCRWCAATGRRLRVGRRVWNGFARVRREGTR